MASRRRAALAALALLPSLALAACAPGEQNAVAPTAAAPDNAPTSAAPAPQSSALPVAEPTDEVLEAVEDYDDTMYAQTWPLNAWPSVPVPPSPAARIDMRCTALLAAAGQPAGVTVLTVQPTVDTLGARQGGATVCQFSLPPAGAAITATLTLAADAGADTSPRSLACFGGESSGDSFYCWSALVEGNGAAHVDYVVPDGYDTTQSVAAMQPILDAAQRLLAAPGTLRAAPSIARDAMGEGSEPCTPSAEQRAAVFSQVDLGQNPDVYGNGYPGQTALQNDLHRRVDTNACWWFFGWQGAEVTIVPGAGWVTAEAGVQGTPVTVAGAESALRTETTNEGDEAFGETDEVIITIVASARGSAVVGTVYTEPGLEPYWRERLVGVLEAIIGTQP